MCVAFVVNFLHYSFIACSKYIFLAFHGLLAVNCVLSKGIQRKAAASFGFSLTFNFVRPFYVVICVHVLSPHAVSTIEYNAVIVPLSSS